jgi:hypothetical protein
VTTPAEQLGQLLAKAPAGGRLQTVSAQVVDVTDTGVNLNYQGAFQLDVQCADSYRNRAPGDWVAVRPGTVPVVLWRLGADPEDVDEDTARQIATDIAHDVQVVRAVTWGTAGPSGTGWQTTSTLFVRKNAEGQVELYAQLASQSDGSPSAPPARAPSPVTISPTASGTWRGGSPDDYAPNPTQGDWTGRGDRRGGWFYGSGIAAACSGKTVASMKVSFTRRTGSGVNAKRPMHVYLHGFTSPPSGQLSLGDGPRDLLSLSVGGRGTAVLPAAWRSALASGSARGLAIFASGSTDYAAFSGGTFTITFSA